MKNPVPLIARILLALIFIKSGIGKIMDPTGTQQYMAAYGMPLTGLFLVGAIIFEIFGSLSVLLGYKARLGAIALIIFLVPATLIFHTKLSDPLQMVMFMKNLAMLGGLLMVAYFGPGPISFDEKVKPPEMA
ncbi:MAG: DoxX family protein [candidate division Zixibacteria bacterium RBG_16_43_9]|nr:MAG: DoxX family protein [candidate division Zixibacteria bacterium RBG_16_43_9]